MILELEKDGIEIIPNQFTIEECEELREASVLCIDIDNPEYEGIYKHNIDGGQPAWRTAISLVSKIIKKYTYDERIVSIVRERLGDSILMLNNQFAYRYGGSSEVFDWHVDVTPSNQIPRENDGLQVAIILDTWTEENGAVEFALGSHKRIHGSPKEVLKHYTGTPGTKVFPKAGDVVIWRTSMAHRSNENTTGNPRSYLISSFTLAEGPLYLMNGAPQELVGSMFKG